VTRIPTLNSPFLLGFDGIERLLDRAARMSGDGYPPYNIERVKPNGGQQASLRITLAVAGFSRDDRG
jgi:HSP20 family molecular chaperone IbpA